MNRGKVKDLAKEAGIDWHGNWDIGGEENQLERFAALVEAEVLGDAEPVDNAEKAGAFMEARLWDFIDMAAAWPEAKPDPRTWAHLNVYAPQLAPALVAQLVEALDMMERHFSRYGDTHNCLVLDQAKAALAAAKEAGL